MQSINGTHTPDQRQKIRNRFIAAPPGILTNAQVLGEGMDLPAVDAVVFADRTASVRRIVQALGGYVRDCGLWSNFCDP
ncbi:helicase-related protein [Streptomyces canus]|uniref:helicase-related protein n=1 Tax=Streptomyces canus TaxID=58343 RepID=UPI0027D8A747|nr:helicase-related protein [Streptomyces canus]